MVWAKITVEIRDELGTAYEKAARVPKNPKRSPDKNCILEFFYSHNSAGPTMEREESFTATVKDNEYVIMSGGHEAVRWCKGLSGPPGPALINALLLIGYNPNGVDRDGDANHFSVGQNHLWRVDLTSAEIVK